VSFDLTTGPVAGRLRRQATPMALGLVAIISFDAVDLFFVSQLGDAPLAAISFTFPIIWFLSSIIIGFEAGAASCISRAIGRNDTSMARRQTTDTALLAGSVSLMLCMFGLMTIGPIFRLLGATDELLPLIGDYMSIWYFAEPAAAVLWTCLAAMRARGNSLIEGKIITTAAVINALLDPIFIFGYFGFPRMEIAGAALATLVANLIMLAGTLVYLHVRLRIFATPFTAIGNILASWRQMLHVGLPAMLTNAIVPVANGVIVAMVAGYGIDAIAANGVIVAMVAGYGIDAIAGIAMRVEPMFLIAFYALSAVTSPFVGQNYAAGQLDRVAEARSVIGRFCLVFGLGLAVVLSAVAYPLTGFFTDNDAIRDVAITYLWIMAVSYGSYGMVMATCAAFNGMGYPLPGVVMSSLRTVILFLPLALFGKWLIGMNGIFIASATSNILIALLGFIWFGRRIELSRRGALSGVA